MHVRTSYLEPRLWNTVIYIWIYFFNASIFQCTLPRYVDIYVAWSDDTVYNTYDRTWQYRFNKSMSSDALLNFACHRRNFVKLWRQLLDSDVMGMGDFCWKNWQDHIGTKSLWSITRFASQHYIIIIWYIFQVHQSYPTCFIKVWFFLMVQTYVRSLCYPRGTGIGSISSWTAIR